MLEQLYISNGESIDNTPTLNEWPTNLALWFGIIKVIKLNVYLQFH